MSKYKTEEGVFVDTDKASQEWDEETNWNGNNMISCATGSQWEHETLYRSSKGRYYVVHTSQVQGHMTYARFISEQEAATWILQNEYELPADLAKFEAEITE